MPPRFSIIIPTFNRADKLRRAIQSVLQQTFSDLEVLICDDGSTDSTADVVASFQDKLDIHHLRDENWGGPARPRNNGARAARGEWLCFLDADDWWYPDKLQRVYDLISDADVIHHDSDIYASSGKSALCKMRSRTVHPPVFVDMMTKGNPFITSGVCVRKAIFDQAGGFSEEKALVSVEDFDLWLRIAMITSSFVHLPLPLGGYWRGDGNISASPHHIAAHAALFDKYKDLLPPNDRKESERYFSYCMGVAMQNTGAYGQSRVHFAHSLKSRNASLAAKSLCRIMISFLRQIPRGPQSRL